MSTFLFATDSEKIFARDEENDTTTLYSFESKIKII
jgi:hypothetical protein